MLVTTWLSNITFICDRFGYKFWLQSIQNHARHRFQAFLRRHEVIVLFYSNLSRGPFLGQVTCVDLDLVLCSGFDSEHVFSPHVVFLLRDQRMIERLSEIMGATLVSIK